MNNIRNITLLLLFVFLTSCMNVKKIDIAEFSDKLKIQEELGLKLFENYKANPKKYSNSHLNLCDLKYTKIKLRDGLEYFIAEPPKENMVILGRHVKIFQGSISYSTKSCIVMTQPEGVLSSAVVITHLLSNIPTEFHVFVSLKYKKTVYVGTKIGNWIVKNGKISVLDDK